MKLSLRDAARLVHAPERTLLKSIEAGQLRAQRVSSQYRLHRADLLEWATSRGMQVEPDLMAGEEDEALPTLSGALAAGGVHHGVPAHDRESALRAVVDRFPLPAGADREFLVNVLLAREALGSTGVGDGIAIPHVRNPIVLHVEHPLVCLCYLEHAVDFGALDGQPVHTLFSLVSPTVKSHLRLLSRLAFALRDAGFRAAIARKGGRDEVLAAVRAVEERIEKAPAAAPPSRSPA
jgi:PTS system nitrogen regulatory IIA component